MPFLKSEHILPDATPVYFNYCYIADGVIIKNKMIMDGMTVRDLKRRGGYDEIRRLEIFSKQRPEPYVGDFVGDELKTLNNDAPMVYPV